ncbi:endonuclease/exonuclease/phosphatase family protein [Solicola sp. PLA-1-18]|uniref:endonuclease/exonuclease/phosphatase family protein n=1 Tax=Solicola sp. PLA-1-18 TaxID=3380532 RepID=UPI003B799D70
MLPLIPAYADASVGLRTTAATAPQSLTVATFNVEKAKTAGGRRSWKPRRKTVLDLLRRTKADVVVLQEANASNYRIRNGTPVLTPSKFPAGWLAAKAGYRVVPHGRSDGVRHPEVSGPHILYNPNRLSVDMSGRGPAYSASVRDAVMTDRKSGRRFRLVGVHLANASRDRTGEEHRLRNLKLLDDDSAKRDEVTQRLPAIYLGDFNTFRAVDPPLVTRELRHRGLVDSVTVAKKRLNHRINTYNGLRRDVAKSGRRIDQIWVPRGTAVHRWHQLVNVTKGRYVGTFASDHNPVLATIRLPR